MSSVIRRALPEESALLTQIAHASKRHWNYPESWIEAWRRQLTITPEFVAANDVYVIEGETGVKGFHALVARDSATWLEHLWVLPEVMRKGLGRELFVHAGGIARMRGATELHIESDPNAEGFYLRMGAQRLGTASSIIDGRERSLPQLVFQL